MRQCTVLLKSIRFDKEGEKALHKIKKNGMLDWSKFVNSNPEKYVDECVLSEYEEKIDDLDMVSLKSENVEEALNYARLIKQICDENDVELVVIAGPIFISNRAQFECNAYYDYLEQLTNITDIYDFSDINDINANPYNFFDRSHYNYVLADKEIGVVFGDETCSEFGIKLTSDNIVHYIIQRKEKFNELLKEYELTGTIKYQSYEDRSRLIE